VVDVTPLPKQKASKRKPPTAAALKKKATRLWGEYVHLRDRVCQVCGKADGKLDAHHILPREFSATRADPDNGVLLCFQHHNGARESVHGDPFWAVEFYTRHLGADAYNTLRNRAYDGVKGTYGVAFWRDACAELEELLAGVR
jgi:hypothetical protein